MSSEGELRPIPRNPLRFELLQMFAAHVKGERGALHDVDAPAKFITSLNEPLTGSLADDSLLRGLQAESLFEGLVVSLGRVHLLKREDCGTTWSNTTRLKVPDFRAALEDGTEFLVEVKHFFQKTNKAKPFSISKNYLAGLRSYEALVGTPIKLGVYWSGWNLWTLVPLAACTETASSPSLTLERAIMANEMSLLGDVHVGTTPPLRLRVVADTRFDRKLDADGNVQFTIGAVELYCAERKLTRNRESTVALALMLYGDWEEHARAEIDEGALVAVDFIFAPATTTPDQGFELVGSLSSMYSNMYRLSTNESGKVAGLNVDVVPGSLSSLIPSDYASKSLPLWRFTVEPKSHVL
jgi:hypothetical protein